MSDLEEQPRVLTASVSDFRYFAALLRGVSFANVILNLLPSIYRAPLLTPGPSQRATVQINADGLTVTVEDNRVLVGEPHPADLCLIARFGNMETSK
ncbi:hypothetical protein V8D89_003609 [Ganoderma adspersum]